MNADEVDNQNKRFEDYTTMMNREIRNAVKKAIEKKSRQIEAMHPLERLNIGADDDGLTVAKLLALKAEKEDLGRVNDEKANKKECENLKDSIKILDG